VRFTTRNRTIEIGDKIFYEDVFLADPTIFDVFTIPLVVGDPRTVLKDTHSIIISEEMRVKYFGEDKDIIGKMITIDKDYVFKIAGVFKTFPPNSHFRFHFLASILRYRKDYISKWGTANYWTYILAARNSQPSIKTFAEKMPQFVEKYRGKEFIEKYKLTYSLQPLTRIHLHSNSRNEIETNQDITTVYIFGAIALFILLIACLNYINLTSARFTSRGREMGLRKVLGATPQQLVKQFLGESLLFAAIAMPMAMILAKLFLPLFNNLSGKSLAFHYFSNPILVVGLVGIILFVGLISGMVPALFIPVLQPSTALRGMFKTSPAILVLRRALVVFQFCISTILIITALVISNQLHFMRTQKLGLNKKNVIMVHLKQNKEAIRKYETIKHEFLQHPDVTAVSASDFFPGRPRWNNNYWHDGISADDYRMISSIPVDHDFFETLQINFVEGRSFDRRFPTDESSAFIINESAVTEFGWHSAVDKAFKIGKNWKKGKIVGVVEDFHFNSMHRKIQPLVFYIDPPNFEYISVRINPDNVSRTLDFIKKKWAELVPSQTFVYSFLAEDFDRLYRTEIHLLEIFLIAAALAIFIACLGSLGLAAFTVEKRTREIGVRKVFGASVQEIVLLLLKEFTLWIMVANLIAWPIAWFAANKWLQNFAYRLETSIWTFLAGGFFTLTVALLVVSYKVARAASANPVKALRYE
jgi:putative ABC transport system permease protein